MWVTIWLGILCISNIEQSYKKKKKDRERQWGDGWIEAEGEIAVGLKAARTQWHRFDECILGIFLSLCLP